MVVMTLQMIEWTNAISTGVADVDADHKKLIDLLNQIFISSYAGVSSEMLDKILKELMDYTIYHFDREEKYLSSSSYPFLSEHHAQHEKLKDQLREIISKVNESNLENLSDETYAFLRGWLVDHIKIHDLRYVEVLSPK
jgi:hemerythrin